MVTIPNLGIILNLPAVNGVFNNGALAALGALLGFFLGAMILIWIGFSIYGAYKFILSNGDPKGIEGGMTLIKNVWISISVGIIFFIVISVIGTFLGVGDVTKWYYQLAQCHNASGSFFFKDNASHELADLPTGNYYCCKVVDPVPQKYSELELKSGSYHYIGVSSGSGAPKGFSECVLFK